MKLSGKLGLLPSEKDGLGVGNLKERIVTLEVSIGEREGKF